MVQSLGSQRVKHNLVTEKQHNSGLGRENEILQDEF